MIKAARTQCLDLSSKHENRLKQKETEQRELFNIQLLKTKIQSNEKQHNISKVFMT